MDRRRFLKTAAVRGAATALGSGVWWGEDNGMSREASAAETPRRVGTTVSLAGEWSMAADGRESVATVPGCWERDGRPATLTGPVTYRRDVSLPETARAELRAGGRLWWECDAVSYHCAASVNGAPVGEHTGLWDAFAFEVPSDSAAQRDGRLALALAVEKPGAARFPIRETMAGFLPYVWGTWGGPWQEMRLRTTGPAAIRGLRAPGRADGTVAAVADLDMAPGSAGGTAVVRFALSDEAGRVVARREVPAAASGEVRADLKVEGFRDALRWSPEKPTLFTLDVTVEVGGVVSDGRRRLVGFRDVTVDGERILVNGAPVYLRMPLSWGWYEDSRAPNPPEEVFRAELERVRDLGFNGMKLCLWIPPQSYFEIADRMGMLLWVELPMWLPQSSEFCRKQTPVEYRRIVRQVGDHPSVAVWTVGCEIGAGMDAAFLRELYEQVKEDTGSPLVRDNSGSAECYGGPMPESADFHDFHLYCDLPQARPTFASFHPAFRPRQPFLFGEFCDQDALRDLPGLAAKRGGKPPWWAVEDGEHNPKGVRWEYTVVRQLDLMKQNGLLERRGELHESARKQALLTRKLTLELVRSQPHMGGYVITGLVDTPISSAGLFDDLGEARFSAQEFRPFNQDTVLFLEPDRRREWAAGGDRPAYVDRYCAWSGSSVRRHVGVSHYGVGAGPLAVRWRVSGSDGRPVARGEVARDRVAPGDVVYVDLFTFTAPAVDRPTRLRVSLEAEVGGRTVTNDLPLWVFPKPGKDEKRRVGVYDPAGHLSRFADAVGIAPVPLDVVTGKPSDGKGDIPVLVATAWRPDFVEFARLGGHVIYLQPGASDAGAGYGLPAPAMPFWREAMRLFDPNPVWGEFPHENETGALFYGLAADAAFELDGVRAALGPKVTVDAALTRVDARAFTKHGYLLTATAEKGSLTLTTLRLHGGLGDEPSGLTRNVAGAYLLRAWLDRAAAAVGAGKV